MMGPNLSQRSTQPEFMDTQSVSLAEFHDCLRTLRIINTYTLAYRPTLRWFERMMAGVGSPISVLDIGCGKSGNGQERETSMWNLSASILTHGRRSRLSRSRPQTLRSATRRQTYF